MQPFRKMIAATIIATTSSGSAPGGHAPVASFSVSDPNPIVGEVIGFESTSPYAPTSWSWTLNGVPYSTQAGFGYYATSVGYITVALTVSNQFGSDSSSQQIYVATNR